MTATHRLVRSVGVGVLAGVGTAAVIGVSTDVIPNGVFSRQIPVRPFDVVVLVVLSLLTGALAATYGLAAPSGVANQRVGVGAGFLGWFAVSCPVCNKVVIALVGVSGATGVVEPLQPALGALAVALAAAALVARVRAIRRGTCAVARPVGPGPAGRRALPGPR
jgi:hypothetical protein